VDPKYWISVLEDQLTSLPESDPEAAWLACADAAWSCTARASWPLRVLHMGLLHQATLAARPAEVRQAIDAALLPWALGEA
jgi:hypothetical protein